MFGSQRNAAGALVACARWQLMQLRRLAPVAPSVPCTSASGSWNGVSGRYAVAYDPPVPNTVLDKLNQPSVLDRIEKVSDVRIKHPVDLPLLYRHYQCIQRIVLASSRTKSIGKSLEINLVDGIEYFNQGPLNDLILQHRYTDRPLSAIFLRNVCSLERSRMVCTTFKPLREIP